MDGDTAPGWSGEAELLIARAGFSRSVGLEWAEKPTQPGRILGWGGRFRAEAPTVPATGRATVLFPTGAEADVMVESFDAVTGEGTFFGLGAPPTR